MSCSISKSYVCFKVLSTIAFFHALAKDFFLASTKAATSFLLMGGGGEREREQVYMWVKEVEEVVSKAKGLERVKVKV